MSESTTTADLAAVIPTTPALPAVPAAPAPTPKAGAVTSAPAAPAKAPAEKAKAPTIEQASKEWLKTAKGWGEQAASGAESPDEIAAEPVATEPRGPARDPETGKFVAKAAAETPSVPATATNAPAEGEAAVTGEDGADEPVEAQEPQEPVLFTLPGDPQRGEADIEIDVSGLPEEVVQRLARAKNEGMRRAEYNAGMSEVKQAQAELKAVESEIALNPVGFMLNRLAPARQLDVAKALLLANFDELAPDIARFYNDPSERRLALADTREHISTAREQASQAATVERRGALIAGAVMQLVPEGASPADAADFLADAQAYLTGIARTRPIDPSEVPSLLASRVRRYGFTGAAPSVNAGTPPTTPAPAIPRLAVAKPATPSAEKLAETAKATQQRIQRAQAARSQAAAVTPAGAGALPIERVGPPQGADIKEASKWLRKNGGTSWGQPST